MANLDLTPPRAHSLCRLMEGLSLPPSINKPLPGAGPGRGEGVAGGRWRRGEAGLSHGPAAADAPAPHAP